MKKIIPLIFVAFVLSSCAGFLGTETGSISVMIPQVKKDVRSEYEKSDAAVFEISVAGIKNNEKITKKGVPGQLLVFDDIQSGKYSVTASVFNKSGVEIADGSTFVTVEAGKTSVAEIKLTLKTNPDTKITGISVTYDDAKTEYNLGEVFDSSGFILNASTSDGIETFVPDAFISVCADSASDDKITSSTTKAVITLTGEYSEYQNLLDKTFVSLTVNVDVPVIIEQPQNIIYSTSSSSESQNTMLSFEVSSVSDEKSSMSYQWQKSTEKDGTYSDIEGACSSSYETGVKDSSYTSEKTYFRCVVKNTNSLVNGNKEETVTSDCVLVAKTSAAFQSFSAVLADQTYGYVLEGTVLSADDFTITETYSDGSTYTGNSSDYTISLPDILSGKTAFAGLIPVTIKRTGSTVSYDVDVTYKYNLASVDMSADENISVAAYTGEVKVTASLKGSLTHCIYSKTTDGGSTEDIADTIYYNLKKNDLYIEENKSISFSAGSAQISVPVSAFTSGSSVSFIVEIAVSAASDKFCAESTSIKYEKEISATATPWKVEILDSSSNVVTKLSALENCSVKVFNDNQADFDLSELSVQAGDENLAYSDGNWSYTVPCTAENASVVFKVMFGNYEICSASYGVVIKTFSALKQAVSSDCKIIVGGNISISENLNISKNVSITSDGDWTLIRDSSFTLSPIFTVDSTGSLTLGSEDENETNTLTIDGASESSPAVESSSVLVSSYGTLKLMNGCIVQNNKNTATGSSGAGVYVGGSFICDGAKIQNCEVTDTNCNGAGIYLSDYTTSVSIKNSAFSNNKAKSDGSTAGALYINLSSVLCEDDATVENCSFESNSANFYGGAVRVECDGGTVNMNNCTFKRNTASINTNSRGGAIYLYSGTLIVNNITFESNSVYSSNAGADIFMYGNAKKPSMTLKGSLIKTAADIDAYIENGASGGSSFELKTGEITQGSGIVLLSLNCYTANTTTPFLTAEDGVTLSDYVEFYTLADSAYIINNDGTISSN